MPGLSFLALAGGAYALYLVYLAARAHGRPNARALPYQITSLAGDDGQPCSSA